MAAQVLSGTGNVSYTNTTGQNVRVVINLIRMYNIPGTLTLPGGITMDIKEYTVLGKSMAFANPGGVSLYGEKGGQPEGYANGFAVPTEFALANGDTFSISSTTSTSIRGYNIIIIPEAG